MNPRFPFIAAATFVAGLALSHAAPHSFLVGARGEGVFEGSLDPETGEVSPLRKLSTEHAGWLAADASGRHVFAVGPAPDSLAPSESAVRHFHRNPDNGALTLATISATLGKTACFVDVSPNGRFLYNANRGSDTIALVAFDTAQPALSLVQTAPKDGKNARSLAVSPDGQFLLSPNQSSGDITVFAIDSKSGTLTQTGKVASVPAPASIRFLPAP